MLQRLGQPLHKKLVTVVLDAPAPYAWGGEALLLNGQPVGELSSVGWSPKANACIALACVRGDAAQRVHTGTPVEIDLWGETIPATGWDVWPPRP